MMKLTRSKILILTVMMLSIFSACNRITFDQAPWTDTTNEQSVINNQEGESPSPREYLSIATPKRITTLNPTKISDTFSASQLNMMGEGLYRQLPSEQIIPGVINEERTQIQGNMITFEIKDDARWSNGDAVIADDFIIGWQELINPNNDNHYGNILNGVVQNASEINNGDLKVDQLMVTALDAKTLQIELVKPIEEYELLEELFAFPVLYPVPSQSQENINLDEYGTSSENTVSNGPYIINDWQEGWETWNFTKNPEYWNSNAYPITTLSFQNLNSQQIAKDLYNNQLFDIVYGFYDLNNTTDYVSNVYLQYNEYNNKQNVDTPFGNEKVRSIITQSLDRDQIIDNLSWDPEAAQTIFPYTNEASDYSTDNKSKEELADEFNKVLNETDYEGIEVDLLINETQLSNNIAQEIKKNIENTLDNIVINIQSVSNNLLVERINSREYDFALMSPLSWNSKDALNYYSKFLTNSSSNQTGFSNEDYDAIFQGVTYGDNFNGNDILEAERILQSENIVVPLIRNNYNNIYREEVINLNGNNYTPSFDFIETRFIPGEYTIPIE